MSELAIRQCEIVYAVAEFLSDWIDDDTDLMSIDENISCIESYGVKFVEPCNDLVINSLRHLKDVINPWNDMAMCDTLIECCILTVEECRQYYPFSAKMMIVFG